MKLSKTFRNDFFSSVYVLETGPLNKKGQYEYVILAVNCNYPIYVYARDPVDFKQRYEPEVNG